MTEEQRRNWPSPSEYSTATRTVPLIRSRNPGPPVWASYLAGLGLMLGVVALAMCGR